MEEQIELFPDMEKNPEEVQVGGSHYRDMIITPTEYIVANDISWLEANAIKYLSRHKKKGGRQDIEKAIHYCHLILAHHYKD